PLLSVDSGMSRGFDDYRVMLPAANAAPHENGSVASRLLRRIGHSALIAPASLAKTQAPDVTAAALQLLRLHATRPLFLWLHYIDTHDPYAPPVEFLPSDVEPGSTWSSFSGENGVMRNPRQLRIVKQLYQGEVRVVDRSIGALLDEMRRAK